MADIISHFMYFCPNSILVTVGLSLNCRFQCFLLFNVFTADAVLQQLDLWTT